MSLRDILQQIMDLQPSYDSTNTSEMQIRSSLVRRELPQALDGYRADIAERLNVDLAALHVLGSDGVGRKTQFCWARFASVDHSPNPRTGWYVVFLFDAEGENVYLSLNQGSTIWNGMTFKPYPEKTLRHRVAWAVTKLQFSSPDSRRVRKIVLGGAAEQKLGRAYEAGNVIAYRYASKALPSNETIRADILYLAQLLGQLYRAQDLGQQPGSPTPESVAIAEIISPSVKRNGGRGQGRGLTAAERRAVEIRAMELAKDHLGSNGYDKIQDTSATHPYDLLATQNGSTIIVEVKGTTSPGETIILTAGELKAQREAYPNNALIIIHSISLTKHPKTPTATGGKLDMIRSWEILDDTLEPIAYNCKIPINTKG